MSNILNRQVIISSEPAVEPVTTAEFKTFVSVDGTDDDTLIAEILKVARVAVENYTNRPLINTTYKQVQNSFEYSGATLGDAINQLSYEMGLQGLNASQGFVKLQKSPLVSVTSLITYNVDNTASTYATTNYEVETVTGRLLINNSATLPTNLRTRSAIEVIYVAGYGATASDVPVTYKQAIKIYAQNIYDFSRDRGFEGASPYDMPDAVKTLLNPYRLTIGLNG